MIIAFDSRWLTTTKTYAIILARVENIHVDVRVCLIRTDGSTHPNATA